MAQQTINLGSSANDGNGDSLRVAGAKVNEMMDELYGRSVTAADYGAVGDGVTDDTAAFEALSAVTGKVDLEDGTYLISPSAKISMQCSRMVAGDATIKLGANLSESAIELPNARWVSGITFDGNDKYCCDANYDHFILSITSPSATVFGCTFKNLVGLQDRWQYALGIRWNTRSVVSNCHFEEIHTPTNTANTAGFCGGIFIASDPADTTNLIQSAHTIENCTFAQIYTTANGAAQLFPDSDGIRNYIYDYASLSSTLKDVVANSTITVRGCSFVDVRKSATKLNNCIATVQGCRFKVLDAGAQSVVLSPFRYQSGPYFSLRDVSISGLLIGSGCTLGGTKNYVSNMYYTTTYSDTQAVSVVGESGDHVDLADIENVTVDCAAAMAQLQYVDLVNIRRSHQTTTHSKFLIAASNVATINIVDCPQLYGQSVDYPATTNTVTTYNVRDSKLTSATTGKMFSHSAITNILLDGVSQTSTNGSVISQNVTNCTVRDSDFTTSGTIATRAFDLTGATLFKWIDSALTDTANVDAGIYSNAAQNRINGLICNVTCTNAQVLLAPNGGSATNSLRNATFTGGNAHLIEIQKCNKMQVANVQSEVTNGDIEFWSNSAYTAALANFTGLLAGTPVVKTNYTVTETGTASL